MNIERSRSELLFHTLAGNAAFSGVSGVIMILFAQPIAAVIGAPAPWWLRLLGAGLVAFSAQLFMYVRKRSIPRSAAITIAGLDLCWVVASVALLLIYPGLLTSTGIIAVSATAVVVLVFFELQGYALWKSRSTAPR